MNTAAQKQTRTEYRDEKSVLDQAIEQTSERVRSIRKTASEYLGVPADKVCDLLRNVWHVSKGQPPLTDPEMFVGMSMIARYGLDPIAREVYVTRTKSGLATIIGIDGWIKILDRTDHYDGMEQELIWTDDGKKLEAVKTTIYSKNRSKPTSYIGYASEYGRLSGLMAEKIPWHMLRIFSLRHAARLFTPVGGSVVTEEEARWMDAYSGNSKPQKVTAADLLDGMLDKMPEQNYEEQEPERINTNPIEHGAEAMEVAQYLIDVAECDDIAMLTESLKAVETKLWTPAAKNNVIAAINARIEALRPKRGERAN